MSDRTSSFRHGAAPFEMSPPDLTDAFRVVGRTLWMPSSVRRLLASAGNRSVDAALAKLPEKLLERLCASLAALITDVDYPNRVLRDCVEKREKGTLDQVFSDGFEILEATSCRRMVPENRLGCAERGRGALEIELCVAPEVGPHPPQTRFRGGQIFELHGLGLERLTAVRKWLVVGKKPVPDVVRGQGWRACLDLSKSLMHEFPRRLSFCDERADRLVGDVGRAAVLEARDPFDLCPQFGVHPVREGS